MTDRELMLYRFNSKNIRKTTSKLARELGLDKEVFEDAVQKGLNEDCLGFYEPKREVQDVNN